MRPPRRPSKSVPAWHAGFLAMLPAIIKQVRFAFRHLGPEARTEALQNCIANAMIAYARLYELGRIALAYPSVLGRYAIAQTRTSASSAAIWPSRTCSARTARRRRMSSWRGSTSTIGPRSSGRKFSSKITVPGRSTSSAPNSTSRHGCGHCPSSHGGSPRCWPTASGPPMWPAGSVSAMAGFRRSVRNCARPGAASSAIRNRRPMPPPWPHSGMGKADQQSAFPAYPRGHGLPGLAVGEAVAFLFLPEHRPPAALGRQ